MVARFRHILPFGAELQPDGAVRFRLWAPAEDVVSLVIEDATPTVALEMTADGTGWFELVTDRAQAGTLYRYRFADGLLVPDPASRFQPSDVHGPSQVVDPERYAWRNDLWAGR